MGATLPSLLFHKSVNARTLQDSNMTKYPSTVLGAIYGRIIGFAIENVGKNG